MGSEVIKPEVIKKRMWLEYQYACTNPAGERLECIHRLINDLADPKLDMLAFLQEAADTIRNKLGIKEVTIGLKSLPDGKYRYAVMSGLHDDNWEAHKQLAYTFEEFFSQDIYKFMQISKYTRLYLAEDNPYDVDEEGTFHRDVMLQSARKSLDDTIEGDYIDILILGKGEELLGWIEISGMQNGKFPDGQMMKSLELLASVTAIALSLLKPC
jgi:hypothetical protein